MSEIQQAIEAITKVIKDTCHFAVEDGKCLTFNRCIDTNCSFANEQADKVLFLTYPSGQPMIGILAEEQEVPKEDDNHTWYKDDLGEAGRIGYRLALDDMLKAGWRRCL